MLRARYRRIVLFFARILTSILFWDILSPRFGLRNIARRTRSRRLRRSAAEFRALAVNMGGVLIKVGQFLSARVDVLPVEITEELAGLQDEVAPENFTDIKRVAESEFGAPLDEVFSAFHETPLAAASLGQAHRARLKAQDSLKENGFDNVVVKIQRPQIEDIIATDIAALRTVGNWIQRYGPIRRRADVPALLEEFTRTLYEEIDYIAEAGNAETFAENFTNRPGVRAPRVIWSRTTKRVLTLEDVYAIKITNYGAIHAAGIDRADVAQRLFQTYLQQIFVDGFCHADPHPGNLFVDPCSLAGLEKPRGWTLTYVDFGMVARVPPDLRSGLRELLIAVGTRDSARLVRAYQKLDMLLPGADLDLLEEAEAKAFDLFWGKTMSELQEIPYQEMREFAREYRQVLYDMPFQLPQNLLMLGRTVGILSGMCTGLDPNFNVWEGLRPFAEKLIADEARSGWEFWLEEIGSIVGALLTMPTRAQNIVDKMERGDLAVRTPQLSDQVNRLEKSLSRLLIGIIFAAFLFSGAQLYIAGQVPLATFLFAGAGLTLVWLFFTR